MRGTKTKVFNGKRYTRAGSHPSNDPSHKEKGETMSLNAWVTFQRKVNHLNARIVKIAPGVYEAYVR